MNSLLTIFAVFFKTSCFTLSGGLAMLPQLQRDLVEKHKFMTDDECVESIAIAQSLPGPIVYNFAVACGKKIAGYRGAFVAGVGVVIPAFLVMLLIAIAFRSLVDNIYVQKAMLGVQAAAGAVILSSAFQLGKKILKHWIEYVFMVVAFVAMILGGDVVWVLAVSALGGYLFLKFRERGAK